MADMVLTRTDDAVEWVDRFLGFTVEDNMAVWHLDDEGRLTCSTKGCDWQSIEDWIRHPWQLDKLVTPHPRAPRCGHNWLIVAWQPTGPEPRRGFPGEADVMRFGLLRALLAMHGVRLVDTLVLSDTRWWSIRELVTGSTRW